MLSRTTTTQLLVDLVDPANQAVWREFDERYRPILIAFARRLGLSEVDAADAAQEALARFVRSFREGNYDRASGRLHSWLMGIAHHCAIDTLEGRRRNRIRRGESAVAHVEDDEARLTVIWEAECQRRILQHAMEQLRAESQADQETLEAFEMLAMRGSTPESVAAALSMPREKVYLAKHRCLKRLRDLVAQLSAAYEVTQG